MKESCMKAASRFAVLLLAIALSLQMDAWAQETDTEPAETNIVSTLESQDGYTWLVDALKRTGLAKTLKAEGPFTLFAPTDEAIGEGTKEKLDAMTNEELTELLRHHLVRDEVTQEEAATLGTLMTVQGESLTATTTDGGVVINGAAIVAADVEAGNGLIHGIDAVLMLPTEAEADAGS